MVNDDGTLISARRITHPAAVTIALQHFLPQSAKILFILSFEGVAGPTQAMREDLSIPAAAM
jgi:hypothetical protein